MRRVIIITIIAVLHIAACEAGDGEPCVTDSDCASDLVCTQYGGESMCLRRCDPHEADACGDDSWCTVASGAPGLKCTPPLEP